MRGGEWVPSSMALCRKSKGSHMPSDGEHRGAHRLSLPGRLVTGVIAIVLAINASLDSEYVGAGVLLIAAALAFGHGVGQWGSRQER